jgi:RNA recognition motif-containing protein
LKNRGKQQNPQGSQRYQNPEAPKPDVKPALSVVQGTLAERKLKVKNIDARVVSVQDLLKLFGKCGPLITASFDTNQFGGNLGTATVIYSKASSASRAIKDYNLAKIDNRPMRVMYALAPGIQLPSGAQVTQPQKAIP